MISKNALKEYIEHGAIPAGPLTVHVDITNTCNLNCVTCWNYSPYLKEQKSTEWQKLKLSVQDFKKIIGDLRTVKVKKLIISGGGEPFTHEGIYDMIAMAKGAGFDVTVITNAVLIDVKRLLEDAPNKLLVNLCAATATTYAKFHPNRKPGDFDSLCDSLKIINRQIPLNLAMVISNVNYNEVAAMARLATTFPKARLSFKLAGLTGDTAHFALTRQQKQGLISKDILLCGEICRDNHIEHNLDVFRSQLSGQGFEYPIQTTGCFAGLFYSRIYSSGDVFFCCSHIKVGNIFEMPFSQIWESDAYNRVRKLMERKEFFPECKRCGKYNLNFQAHRAILEACI
jgi:radical SAM protein with 4Fe4S-binding SPASM domain